MHNGRVAWSKADSEQMECWYGEVACTEGLFDIYVKESPVSALWSSLQHRGVGLEEEYDMLLKIYTEYNSALRTYWWKKISTVDSLHKQFLLIYSVLNSCRFYGVKDKLAAQFGFYPEFLLKFGALRRPAGWPESSKGFISIWSRIWSQAVTAQRF